MDENIIKMLKSRGKGARSRCVCISNRAYKNYGGRGIKFEFESIDAFVNHCLTLPNVYADMELDRIDNNGNYCPGNIRFVNKTVNNQNTRKNHYIVYNGESYCIAEFTRRFTKVDTSTVSRSVAKGMSPEDIIKLTPVPRLKVQYCGQTYSFKQFVELFTNHTYTRAHFLYRQGYTLDKLISSNPKT